MRPKGLNIEAGGRERGGEVVGKGSKSPTNQGLWGSAVSSPAVFGVEPRPPKRFPLFPGWPLPTV